MRKFMRFFTIAALALVLGACTGKEAPPEVENDNPSQHYRAQEVPSDTNVYEITGTVQGAVSSLVRQTDPGSGTISGYAAGGAGFVSGYFTGPRFDGKGYVRLLVQTSTPASESAPGGSVVLLKTTDTKATALLDGDIATFKCRRQYEAVAAVRQNETLQVEADGTWELDFCRLSTPVLGTPLP